MHSAQCSLLMLSPGTEVAQFWHEGSGSHTPTGTSSARRSVEIDYDQNCVFRIRIIRFYGENKFYAKHLSLAKDL
jgi:hypothetical protein